MPTWKPDRYCLPRPGSRSATANRNVLGMLDGPGFLRVPAYPEMWAEGIRWVVLLLDYEEELETVPLPPIQAAQRTGQSHQYHTPESLVPDSVLTAATGMLRILAVVAEQ